jgi:ATP-binding cassette, subfamily C (CFTR/MRP), member 4
VQESICVVTGGSGSGKSSVIAAVLSEMVLVGGSLDVQGSCAFAPQVPWLLADTIQGNILLGRALDLDRYQLVRLTSQIVVPVASCSHHATAFVGRRLEYRQVKKG